MIYVFGCNGYLGSSLMDYLSDRGYDVQGFSRNCFPGRIYEEDTIINCAASGYRKGSYGTAQTVYDNFTFPTILDDRRNGANFIQIGSWSEEVPVLDDYSNSKRLATSYLKDRAHILMCCSIWGGKWESTERFMMTFLKGCAKNEPYVITHPLRRRDFVHIDNFCLFLENLIKFKDYSKIYCATGKLYSFFQVKLMLESIAGREFPNVKFVDDMSANYDWHPVDPVFDDTLREDMEREWRKLTR